MITLDKVARVNLVFLFLKDIETQGYHYQLLCDEVTIDNKPLGNNYQNAYDEFTQEVNSNYERR